MMHSIILSNTACKDEFPGNKNCEFTNRLNIPIDTSQGKWVVNLSEIIYAPFFWLNNRKPSTYIDVGISNFEHTELITDSIICTELHVNLKHPITDWNAGIVLNVSVRLLKREGVKYKNMIKLADVINIWGYMENGFDKYGKKLPWPTHDIEKQHFYYETYKFLKLREDDVKFIHDVSLSKIDILKKRLTPRNIKIQYDKDKGRRTIPATKHEDLRKVTFTDTNNFIREFNFLLNDTIKDLLHENSAKYSEFYIDSNEEKAYLSVVMKNERCVITQSEHSIKRGFDIRFKMHKMLQYILGFTKYPYMDYGEFKISQSELTSTHNIDISRDPPACLWIFSDIVKPSYINNVTLPLLRCVTVDKSTHLSAFETPTYEHYTPINQNSISTIKIWISDSYVGNPLQTTCDFYVQLDILQIE